MKELQLIDRVVVEIRGEEGEKCSPFDIAQELRKIADRIDDCIKGDNELRTNPNNGHHTELLWERECTAYGFRMGDKSLIGMHYYGSEKKPKKYIVIVSVYDEENTQAYPLGGVFNTEEQAKEYIRQHVYDVIDSHWTKGRRNTEEGYEAEYTVAGGFVAQDMYSGQSLEIEIREVEEML